MKKVTQHWEVKQPIELHATIYGLNLASVICLQWYITVSLSLCILRQYLFTFQDHLVSAIKYIAIYTYICTQQKFNCYSLHSLSLYFRW
jgi:hypothetical protein